MAQRNSEMDGAVLVGVLFAFMFMVLYAVACFMAIVLTIVAVCAWHQKLTIFKWTITPREARTFISSGIVGLVGVPIFCVFCASLFHVQIRDDWWGYILLGGYSLGALGLGSAILEDDQKKEAINFLTFQSPPPAASLPIAPTRGPSGGAPPAEGFRFATWDDEMPLSGSSEAGASGSQALTTLNSFSHKPRADDGSDCPDCPCHWTREDIDRIVKEILARGKDRR